METAGGDVEGVVLTLGDIDPDTPAKRVRKLQPLATVLAARLRSVGVSRVKILLTRNIEEMSKKIHEGGVDLYMDSPYPILRVQQATGGELIAQRWVGSAVAYHSVLFTAEPQVQKLADLKGRLLALQESYSTSGYALPVAHLLTRGFTFGTIGASAPLSADRIEVMFSGDEENTVALVESGRAAAGAIASTDFADLPVDRASKLRVLDRTANVPRSLVLARPGIEARLRAEISAVLLSLDPAEVAAEAARAGDLNPWTWHFEAPPGSDDPGLKILREALRQLR